MFAWASHCFYWTLLLYFPFIICFGFLPTNLMVLGCVQAFQFAPYTSHCNHLHCPKLTREHIHYAWNSQDALTSYLGKEIQAPSSIHGANCAFSFKNFLLNLVQVSCHLIPQLHHFHNSIHLVFYWINFFKPLCQIWQCILSLTFKPFQNPWRIL
jgi:hypothetical protein